MPVKGDMVPGYELFSALKADLAVERNFSPLDSHFGHSTRTKTAAQLEKIVQTDKITHNFNCFHRIFHRGFF